MAGHEDTPAPHLEPPGASDGGLSPAGAQVEVRISADAAGLPLLRSIAAALAVAQDFDIDTMADLRMATDELGATLVTRAAPGAVLTCRFAARDGSVAVEAVAAAASQDPIDEGSFGWMVLATLADTVRAEVTPGSHGSGPQARMALTVTTRRAVR